jgi:hypothetical protein
MCRELLDYNLLLCWKIPYLYVLVQTRRAETLSSYTNKHTHARAPLPCDRREHSCICIGGCIQKFPDWPPGARTANGTALCHEVQLYRQFVSQSSEFCRHNLLCCFSTSVYSCCLFRYRLSAETFGYTLVCRHQHTQRMGQGESLKVTKTQLRNKIIKFYSKRILLVLDDNLRINSGRKNEDIQNMDEA